MTTNKIKVLFNRWCNNKNQNLILKEEIIIKARIRKIQIVISIKKSPKKTNIIFISKTLLI